MWLWFIFIHYTFFSCRKNKIVQLHKYKILPPWKWLKTFNKDSTTAYDASSRKRKYTKQNNYSHHLGKWQADSHLSHNFRTYWRDEGQKDSSRYKAQYKFTYSLQLGFKVKLISPATTLNKGLRPQKKRLYGVLLNNLIVGPFENKREQK